MNKEHALERQEEVCPFCGGTGYVPNEPDEYGYTSVRTCSCAAVKEAKRAIKQSGLSDLLDFCTFDSFQTRNPWEQEMAQRAARYVDAVASGGKPWLFIGGQPGCGKTHICTAVCGKLLKEGIEVKYMVWLTESRKLKILANDPEFDEAIRPFMSAKILYIDDLFKQGPTDADIRIAFEILNSRYNEDKPTIISSERMIRELFDIDEGTISRIVQKAKGYTVNIARDPAKDFRLS